MCRDCADKQEALSFPISLYSPRQHATAPFCGGTNRKRIIANAWRDTAVIKHATPIVGPTVPFSCSAGSRSTRSARNRAKVLYGLDIGYDVFARNGHLHPAQAFASVQEPIHERDAAGHRLQRPQRVGGTALSIQYFAVELGHLHHVEVVRR